MIVVFTLVFIGPLYFLFTDGLKSTQEAIATPPTLYPHHVYPGNYLQAWNRLDVGRMLWNTVYYAFGALAFQLVFDVAAAYSLSKLRPVLGNVVLFLMLATLMIPATVLVVPQYVTIVEPADPARGTWSARRRRSGCRRWPTRSTSSCSSGSSTRSRRTTSTPRRSTARPG